MHSTTTTFEYFQTDQKIRLLSGVAVEQTLPNACHFHDENFPDEYKDCWD
jgi:hypothetical protein